ncbi:MAG TPA: ABC transporter substrate-binding protein [Alphaproteobacteria bacterium]
MPNLQLTFACDNYAHTRALRENLVKPEGVDLTYLTVFPAETFQRMVQFNEFDCSEMGMKFYVSTAQLEKPPFVAIPVFPSRSFRHAAIYVSEKSGIREPKDLKGKKVGELFAYGHDAAIWARGIMSDEYGVPIDSVTYYVGRLDKTTAREFAPFPPPSHIKVEQLGPDQTLDAMLESGEIDALYSAIVPPSFLKRNGTVRRLFSDYKDVERAYYRKTGIFPIMHTMVVRRDIYEEHRWVAQSLYKAMKESKRHAYDYYVSQEKNMHRLMMVPWLTAHLEENREVLGEDLWPYGLDRNFKAVDAFLRYHFEQGLSKRRLSPEELFAPETLVDYFPYKPPH